MSIDFSNKSLVGFLESISSDEPVPGGGSVSAYVAAMGVALLKKTLVFTLKKDLTEDVRSQILNVISDADELLEEFLKMVNKDAEVFLACINDKSKPFSKRFEESRLIANHICDLCHKAYKVHAKGSYLYNKSMKTDYEAAQRLIDASFRISWENAHYGEED